MDKKKKGLSGIFFVFIGSFAFAQAPVLTLEDYLNQVKSQNLSLRSLKKSLDASLEYRAQKELLVATQAFFSVGSKNDASLQPFLLVNYDSILTNSYSTGIRKQTSYGLKVGLHYDVFTQQYTGAVVAPLVQGFVSGNAFFLKSNNASAVLEVTQNLWSNGFGRGTQAQMQQIEQMQQSSAYQSRFTMKQMLMDAELKYWNLVTTRGAVDIQKKALDRAQQMNAWIKNKRKLNLKEESDVVQSNALLRLKELQLLSIQKEERVQSALLNQMRHQDADTVAESLLEMQVEGFLFQKDIKESDAVIALRFMAGSKQSAAQYQQELLSPILDLSASFATNGQRMDRYYASLTDAFKRSFSFARPSQTVQLQFSLPLDFESIRKNKSAFQLEALSAMDVYERKKFEEQQNWHSLKSQLMDAQHILMLAIEVEKAEQEKLFVEKKRLTQGRSTTYQILMFEDDYLSSQLSRLQQQLVVLTLQAQLKIFGDAYESSQPFD